MTALCTGSILIVAGGWGEDGKVLSTVKLMNTEDRQWSTAADLSQLMYCASATVCEDQIYIFCRLTKAKFYTRSNRNDLYMRQV